MLTAADQVTLERNTLATQGIAVVELKARESPPGGELVPTVNFGDGGDSGRHLREPGLVGADVFYCPNRVGGSYLHYRLEVVDRVGNDSFTPGHGVLPRRAATKARRASG